VRVAIIVGNEELGLPVVSLYDIRDRVPELLQALSDFVDVGWSPVQMNAMVVFRFGGCSCTPVKPEIQVSVVVNHAADQLAFVPHFSIHRKTEPFDPKAQALVEIRAGNHRYAGFNRHRGVSGLKEGVKRIAARYGTSEQVVIPANDGEL
jgi:hypothetical protein